MPCLRAVESASNLLSSFADCLETEAVTLLELEDATLWGFRNEEACRLQLSPVTRRYEPGDRRSISCAEILTFRDFGPMLITLSSTKVECVQY
jgi:hypothetical protein